MSIGPGPSTAGSLVLWADTPAANIQDANGDVASPACPAAGTDNEQGSDGMLQGTSGIGPSETTPAIPDTCNSDGGPSNGDNGTCPPPESTGGCVVANTRISLYPEGCCEAWELRDGDIVMTRSAEGLLAGESVVRVVESMQPCIALQTEDGRVLECSLSHPVMSPDALDSRGRQILAADFQTGESLMLQDGAAIEVSAVTRLQAMRVYQIMLAGPHHVYLSNGIWSHNKIGVGWPAPGVVQPP